MIKRSLFLQLSEAHSTGLRRWWRRLWPPETVCRLNSKGKKSNNKKALPEGQRLPQEVEVGPSSAPYQGWPNLNQVSAKLLVSPCFARVRPVLPGFGFVRLYFARLLPDFALFYPVFAWKCLFFAHFCPISPRSFGFIQLCQDLFSFVRPLFAWFRPSLRHIF